MRHNPYPFTALVGQPLAAALLTRSLQQEQIATTYLFEGIAGIGKETAARLFAAQLLKCEVTALNYHPDFISLAAETGGMIRIQQIRDLVGQVSTYPLQSERRVVIVQSAQDLNAAAGNAFLKTLEESLLTTFILLCDQTLKLATIRSRGQAIPFYSLAPSDLKTVLYQVAPALLDYPSLLQCAEGSPGAALEHWKQAAQCLDMKQALCPLPLALEAQYQLAQATSNLPAETQQWLLTFIGYSGWRHHGVLGAIDAARKQLKQHCHALTVWEHLYRTLCQSTLKLRLDAPPYHDAAIEDLDETEAEETETASATSTTAPSPTATQAVPGQGSLFSYRPQ